VDGQGNAVSNTYTLNGAFGSGVTVKGAGILLNNEMDDFASKPGEPNQFGLVQGEKNAIQPGKRPLSSMTPTLVLQKNGKLWFALGSPGGPTIISTMMQIVVNVIDHGMTIQQAVDAPRLHHQWQPDEVVWEPCGLPPDAHRLLQAQGHRFARTPRFMGDAQAIMYEPASDSLLGASDPRGDALSVGY
jgi:gamma-glutamyltranspeptidase/glutathione hydrolase